MFGQRSFVARALPGVEDRDGLVITDKIRVSLFGVGRASERRL